MSIGRDAAPAYSEELRSSNIARTTSTYDVDRLGEFTLSYKKKIGRHHIDALAGYTLAPREVQPIQTYLQENLGRNEALVRQIGCVIGTHAGPGAFGLAFLDEGFTF